MCTIGMICIAKVFQKGKGIKVADQEKIMKSFYQDTSNGKCIFVNEFGIAFL